MSQLTYSRPKTEFPRNGVADTAATSASSTQSGRVSFDVRGSAVWEWRTEAGGYSGDINTQRLKKLEAPELELEMEIEQTGKIKKPNHLSLLDDPESDGDFNPYDNSTSRKRTPDPYQARVAPPPPVKPNPTPARKPVKDLKAYGEWLAMKKRLAENKNDD